MGLSHRSADISPVGTCRVCKRRHYNIGFQPSRSHPIKWFCDHCAQFMQEAAALTKKQFDIYETHSMQKGGEAAGAYLDSIGQTDLAELNQYQFLLFFTKFMGGYEDAMKTAFEEMAK